jgi:pyridoxine 5'-phosphate synthase PdxJ
MFPSYSDLPALTNHIRPDRRHVRTASEIRMRIKRIALGA